jgi:hypothetical protein
MLLSLNELKLFFKLQHTLMFYVNQRQKVLPQPVASPDEFSRLPGEVRAKCHEALLAQLDLIDSFVAENPAHLTNEELDIVRSWRHLVHGEFYVFRQLQKYAVFLTAKSPTVAYGVVALLDPLEDLLGPHWPLLVRTVLLPFKGRIVYDGLMTRYSISFGPGIRRSLNESYQEAKAGRGIVTSLPLTTPRSLQASKPPKATKSKPAPKLPTKQGKDDALSIVLGLLDAFCQEHLNEEYAVLCRKLAEKLGRKRPSPLLKGSPHAWASGIVRTVGGVNFLYDKSQTPYMRATDIDGHLGISGSSGEAKAREIRKLFGMQQFDPDWTLPSMMDQNPLVWMLEVNGFLLDIRSAPRETQVIAFQKGLIPYIPADRK